MIIEHQLDPGPSMDGLDGPHAVGTAICWRFRWSESASKGAYFFGAGKAPPLPWSQGTVNMEHLLRAASIVGESVMFKYK